MAAKSKAVIKSVALDLIDRPEDLARLDIDEEEIEELAESIRERGLQQPIKVARRDERFKLIFGDRRVLACKLLERKTIQATVVDATDEEISIDRAIENVQRVDLSPVEEGLQYQGMIEKMGLKLDQVARRVGKKPGAVKRRLDLLRYPKEFINAVHKKQISLTVAEELVRCADAAHRSYLLEMAVNHGITASIARMWVTDWRGSQAPDVEVNAEGGGVPGPGFNKTQYMTCNLCDGPVPMDRIRSILVCKECLEKLNDLLGGKQV